VSETIPNGKVIAVLRHLIMMAYKGSGDISPPILNVNSIWTSVETFRRLPSGTYYLGQWVRARGGMDIAAKTILQPCWESNSGLPDRSHLID
jgi:hypothetical protein